MDWMRCRRSGVVKEACHNTDVGGGIEFVQVVGVWTSFDV